jgi:chemotaxis protein CheC
MADLFALSLRELDALRETANIGAGHAATALSQMTQSAIMITVPTVTIAALEEIPPQVSESEEPVAAVLMRMTGDLTGRTLLLLPYSTALRVGQLMLRREGPHADHFSELEESALKEAGNILSGAYMNALSDFMGLLLLPSPPSFAVDMSAAVLTSAYLEFGAERDVVFAVETQFYLQEHGERLRGFFLLMPDQSSLDALLRAMRIA